MATLFEANQQAQIQLAAAFRELGAEAVKIVEKLLRVWAEVWKNDAQRVVPKETGRLAQSLRAVVMRDGDAIYGIVGTNVEYAEFVELGTARIAGGAVLAWQSGDPVVLDWPAKRADGAESEQMPWLRPTGLSVAPKALDGLARGLAEAVQKKLHGKKFG